MPKILQAQHDFLAQKFLDPRKLMNLFLVNFGGSTTVEVRQQIHSVFIYINLYIYLGRSFALAISSILHNLCQFPSNHGLSMRFIKDRFYCPPLFRFNFCVIDLLTQMTWICTKIITHEEIVRRNFNHFFIDIMAIHMTFYDIIVHNSSCLVSKVLEIAIWNV
jgi:hypothetical protein